MSTSDVSPDGVLVIAAWAGTQKQCDLSPALHVAANVADPACPGFLSDSITCSQTLPSLPYGFAITQPLHSCIGTQAPLAGFFAAFLLPFLVPDWRD